MRLPDGSILMHEGKPYDPTKAHAYYMRVRKLKGRKKGQVVDLNKRPAHNQLVKPKKKRATPQERAAAREKIIALTAKVAKLQKELQDAASTKRKSATKAKASAKKAAKPPTAAEKNAQAKDAKKYRAKNQQQLKTAAKKAAASAPKGASSGGSSKPGALKAPTGKAANIQKQLDAAQTELKAAVERYRALG